MRRSLGSVRSWVAARGKEWLAETRGVATLAPVILGVHGVNDWHAYEDEKRDALDRLAALVERILNPSSANVVELRPAG